MSEILIESKYKTKQTSTNFKMTTLKLKLILTKEKLIKNKPSCQQMLCKQLPADVVFVSAFRRFNLVLGRQNSARIVGKCA